MARLQSISKIFSALTFALALLLARNALSAPTDSISSTTLLGGDLFIQSFLVNRHFAKSDTTDQAFFARKREDESFPTEPSQLSWELGYSYSHPTLLDVHDVLLGLNWEAMPVFEMGVEGAFDAIPPLLYQRGQVKIRLEYYSPLKFLQERPAKLVAGGPLRAKRPDEEVDDDRDARRYFLKRRDFFLTPEVQPYLGNRARRKPGPNAPEAPDSKDSKDSAKPAPIPIFKKEEITYPNLRTALDFEIDSHQRTPSATSAVPVATTASAKPQMTQVGLGLDLTLAWSDHLEFRLRGINYNYSSLITDFLSGISPSVGTTYVIPQGSVAAFAPQILSFPGFIFDEGVTYEFDDSWSADFSMNQVIYAVALQGSAFGFAPSVRYALNEHWSAGLGAVLIAAQPGTAVMGLLNLGYAF